MTSGFLLLFIPTASASGGMSLLPDPTLTALQMVPFLVTMGLLHFLLFKPMIAYLQGRGSATEGTRAEAARLEHEADARMEEYEGRLAQAKAEIQSYAAEQRTLAAKEREAALATARGEAEQVKNKALEELRAEVELASRELDSLGRSLGQDITATVLGPQPSA